MKKPQIIIVSLIILLAILSTYLITYITLDSKYSSFNNAQKLASSLASVDINSSKNYSNNSKSIINNKAYSSSEKQISTTANDKSKTHLKFVNESKFDKKINQKSNEPIYSTQSLDNELVQEDVYIIGVPGIITYTVNDAEFAIASIITKDQVDSDNYSKDVDKTNNQLFMDNFDTLISGQNNEIEGLGSLYRDGIGGFLMKYVNMPLDNFKLKGLDTQRTFLTLEGQSHPLVPVVNVIGKKGEDYVWIKKRVYSFSTFPKSLEDQFDENKNNEFDQMIKVYTSNTETNSKIISTTQKLIEQFAIEN